jgi:hypothetical protein
MEEKINFRVICNDEKYLQSILKWYNDNNKTDFRIVNVIYDEVNFVNIESTKFTLADVFNIGYQFGVKEEKLRQAGKIDW